MDFILSQNNNEIVMIFPVVPHEITLTRGQRNETFDGINGEMQALGTLGLAAFEIASFFPLRQRPFIRPLASRDGWWYVRTIEACRARQLPFRGILLDNNGREVFNLPLSVESFEYGVDQAQDISYRISFREYRFAAMPLTATLPAQASPAGAVPTTAPSPLSQVVTDSQAAAQDGGTFTRLYSDSDVVIMTKLVYGEAGGIPSKVEKACVCWTVCNRLDHGGYGKTLQGVMTAPHQFQGYRASNPVPADLKSLCADVLDRWSRERAGQTGVGRVLPKEYLYFWGQSGHNWFYKKQYKGINKGIAWNYSLPSPY